MQYHSLMHHDIIAFVVLMEKADLLQNLFQVSLNACRRVYQPSSFQSAARAFETWAVRNVVDARRFRLAA
jgi:hypothetical protein